MLSEIILAIIQAATEFLPVSSSGHLALVSNLMNTKQGDLFFFTILHLASLFAILIFTRKEIWKLISFEKNYRKMWFFLIIGTIPAAAAGYFFSEFFSRLFSSLLVVGIGFIVTGIILFSTKDVKTFSKLNLKNSFAIGVAQIFAILPGISRSGITISSARFLGINKEESFRFSFLLAIPLILGATILEFGKAYFSFNLIISFLLCSVLSLLFLNLLHKILIKDKFWMFGFYCILLGIITLVLSYIL